MDLNITYSDKLKAVKECLIDYSGPIYLCGNSLDLQNDKIVTIIDANIDKKELVIVNNVYPEWLRKIKNNENRTNILLIKNFEKISLDNQRLFIDIICNNCVSSENLPDKLRIIVSSNVKCKLIQEIEETVQYFEI